MYRYNIDRIPADYITNYGSKLSKIILEWSFLNISYDILHDKLIV